MLEDPSSPFHKRCRYVIRTAATQKLTLVELSAQLDLS